MPARKYSDEQIAAAIDLRAQGVGVVRIAQDLGMTRGAVEYHCLAQGVSPGDAPAPFINRTQTMRRGGHLVRLFTPAEDARAEAMRIDGASLTEIGRAIGRRPVSVRCRLQALARRAEAAQVAA